MKAIILLTSCFTLLLIGCIEMMNNQSEQSVYPQYIDDNDNQINDYAERDTHFPGDDRKTLAKSSTIAKTTANGHFFHDDDNDGVCDFAQDGGTTWHGPGFTDDNSNNICDFWEDGHSMHNRHEGMMYVDENGNAINDYMERETHNGGAHAFVDENGDDICDLAQDGGNAWHGPGYIDSDNNGICDYWQPGNMGYGRMHHR